MTPGGNRSRFPGTRVPGGKTVYTAEDLQGFDPARDPMRGKLLTIARHTYDLDTRAWAPNSTSDPSWPLRRIQCIRTGGECSTRRAAHASRGG